MVIDRDSYDEPMEVTVAHNLPLPTVLERLKGFTFALKRRFGSRVEKSEESWQGSVLSYYIRGKAKREFRGTVTADERVVTVTVESASLTRPIARGVAKGYIEAALREALGE